MYKVFFNDRIVFISSESDETIANGSLLHIVVDSKSIQLAWENFLNDEMKRNLYLVFDQIDKPHKLLSTVFKIIKASGGLVYNHERKLLCIKRWGMWDLPKGKIDKGEKKKDAALREVEEETSITNLVLKRKETVSYHIYQSKFHNNQWVLKPTYWFSMVCDEHQVPVPQTNEDITEARWLTPNDIKTMVLPNTYQSLLPVFEKALYCQSIG
jgi:8-oxo-dGTP pyrophosphatase MutT (NUDIX family)